MNLALFSQSSAIQEFWFWGSMARQWCVAGCPPAQLLNPRVPSLPQSHIPGVWKSVPDVQYFMGRSLSDPESRKKKGRQPPSFSLPFGQHSVIFRKFSSKRQKLQWVRWSKCLSPYYNLFLLLIFAIQFSKDEIGITTSETSTIRSWL